jgi:sulfur-carrier protein
MVQVVLPRNLQILAGVGRVVELEVAGAPTQRAVLDALEAAYPALLGTMRDHVTKRRRPMIRFFACEEDLSDEPVDAPLPLPVAEGREPFLIIGAIAGGS